MDRKKIVSQLSRLNQDILNQTENKFDLRNCFQSHELDSPFSKQFTIIRSYINDDTRKRLLDLKDLLNNNPEAITIIDNELTKKILYIGSESEKLGRIDVTREYKIIEKVLTDKYISLEKVNKPNIENIVSKWDSVKPSIILISCHGDQMGLFLEDENGENYHYPNLKFVEFFERRSNYTDCVILSSCESLNLGKSISNAGKKVICVNKRVDIKTATDFNKNFFQYINNHSLAFSDVYKDAYDHSIELLKFKELKDAFSIEFINANKIG